MSTYRHFLKDFPTRCTQLLKLTPEDRSLDVTLLLAVAGQAIIIPLERLGYSAAKSIFLERIGDTNALPSSSLQFVNASVEIRRFSNRQI